MDYQKEAQKLKAIAEPNRMKIMHLLSQGTLCACDLLEHFDFTQPTLSHHMRILAKAQVITVEKRGQWHYYTLEESFIQEFTALLNTLLTKKEKKHSACFVAKES